MNYADNKEIINSFYETNELSYKFEKDNVYLEKAFNEIKIIWLNNLAKIKKVNYLMLAEAPLWGRDKKYIYNPDTNYSQFFHPNDLENIVNHKISDKSEFIKVCNNIGLLIVDISPFPLNEKDTCINYRNLTKNQYRELIRLTIPKYFEKKINAIGHKKSKDIKIFFRYKRVKNNFQDLISKVLINNKFINSLTDIEDISKKGGGIDRTKLSQIIKAN